MAMVAYAMGVTQHSNWRNTVKALANLSMETGHIVKESTGLNPLRGQCKVRGSFNASGIPNPFPGYQRVNDQGARMKIGKA